MPYRPVRRYGPLGFLRVLPVCGPACAARAAKAERGADAGPAAPRGAALILIYLGLFGSTLR